MPSLPVQQDVSLQAFNTLAVPARAEFYCALEDAATARAVLEYAQDRNLQPHVLGGGSNLVLGETLPGLCLHQCSHGRELLELGEEHGIVRAMAGENWHDFVQWTLSQGCCGLENLALIPGTVGAAPIQNIGAYGVELEQFFQQLSALDLKTGETIRFDRAQCGFGYRDSVFKRELRDRVLIESVTLRLPRRARPQLSYPALADYLAGQGLSEPSPQQVFDAVVAIRRSKLPDPAQVPNAGSFFKNPVVDESTLQQLRAVHPEMPAFGQPDGRYKLAAGWLIEQCGFRQSTNTAVRVHPEHALVLINPLRCSGTEVQAFAAKILLSVQQRFGIALEQEPRSYV